MRPLRAVAGLLAAAVIATTLVVSHPGAAQAAPPTPYFGPGIDPYATLQSQTSCDPSPKPGTADFRNLVLATYPGTGDSGIGRACGSGGTSEHKEGRAWDWHVSASSQAHIAGDLLNWLLATDQHGNQHAMLRRLGIMYIIWNRQIWRAYQPGSGWQPYNGSNPHTDHVHFSFSWAGAGRATTWWTGQTDPPAPPPSARRGGASSFAVSWVEGRLDVFGRGGGGSVYQNYFDRGAGAGASWPGWGALPGSAGLRSRPTASSWSNGRLDVFAVGADQKMKHWWFDRLGDARWRGPETLGDTTFAGAPSVVSWDYGRLDVFARDTNNKLRHNYAQHGVIAWPAWENLGALAGDPAAVAWSSGRWDVFAVGADQKMKHWWYDRLGADQWLGPQTLGDTTFVGTPAVASWDYGRLDVFARDTNNNLRHNFTQSGQVVWPGWETLAAGLNSSPTAVSQYSGRLDVFYVHNATKKIRQQYFDKLGEDRWIGPVELHDTTFTNTIDVVSWAPGRLDLFGIDTNSQMRHSYAQQGATSGFTGWEQLNGTFQ